jgi:hypothetical protein
MADVVRFPAKPTKDEQPKVTITADCGEAPASVAPSGNWLRNLITMRCTACGHRWLQPSDRGRCVRCRSEETNPIDKRFSAAVRV